MPWGGSPGLMYELVCSDGVGWVNQWLFDEGLGARYVKAHLSSPPVNLQEGCIVNAWQGGTMVLDPAAFSKTSLELVN